MSEFPSNSKKARTEPPEKDIKRVTSSDAVRRKTPLSKQFSDTFIGGNPKSAAHYVVFGVLIPAAKDALSDGVSQGFERLIYGESRGPKRPRPGGFAPGHVSYSRMAGVRPGPPQDRRELTRRARSQHDFDDIVISSRSEAELVVEQLFDLVSQFGSASVADLYTMTGVESTHVDNQWGWTDLEGSSPRKIRGGYLLDLPDPESLK